MGTRIDQRELHTDCGEILRRVAAGESFTVTRDGTPVADFVPHVAAVSSAPVRFVAVETLAEENGALGAVGVAAFESDTRALDAAVDDSDRDPWERR